MHEIGSLLQIPRTLGFIEYNDVLNRRPGFNQSVIAEMVNVLNEGLNALTNLAFANLFPLCFATHDFVPGKCLSQHGDKWAISR